ncbi:MAG: ribosome maturation factor RimP [Gammaproteobacteria bacterium]|jgi:ribosome maturation factor RimP
MRQAPQALVELARAVVEPMGYEFVGLEYVHPGGGEGLLRVYIDSEEGVVLDDCAAVSHQLSGVLDVEEPIRGEYNLEVSSPGLDRPLFEPAHFARFVGRQARVRLSSAQPGRRKYQGEIVRVEDDAVWLRVDGEEVRLAFDQIDSARLVPEF